MKELQEILRSDLEPSDFPGTDAAVLIINKKVPQSVVEELCEPLRCQIRIYPTETGWKIKSPYWELADLLETPQHQPFPLEWMKEPGGWNHEHCSFCHEHLSVGTACFTANHENGGYYVICASCAQKCV
jgi:hypothetical protein